ncbi:MAG: aldehyde dehydrogenase family protein [Rhizobiaceae bacterium]|nr:aldehyde dehydrogenase family protein [Rhizobiaceae bacterium]
MDVSHDTTPVRADMLIGGRRVNSSRRIEVFNPAKPSELVGTIARGTPEHVVDAITAAKKAQNSWSGMTFSQRAAILGRAIASADEGIEERAKLFVRENGKTLAEATGELRSVAVRQRLTLELAEELDSARELAAPNGRTFIGYIPFGVVVSIVPWNGPVGLASMQVIPALLAGNSVVVKPPESCPLALTKTMELIAQELPPGLLNIVTGLPSEIGDTLTQHPDVGKIGFTGSIPSARKIIVNAAQTIKAITAELGGNDAAIVLDDADISDDTMRRMTTIVYRMAGQVCMAIKRIYVPEDMHDHFVDAFKKAAGRVIVGNGLNPSVVMGPLHTRHALERAKGLVEDSRNRGGAVHELGVVDDESSFAEGHFMRPTVVTGLDDSAPLVAEEQFSPIVPVIPYKDVEEALSRANSTIFGLGGSIWSRDIDKAARLARRIEAGTVFVNTHGTQSVNRRAPYGGIKQSGMGRRSGIEGIREYMQIQTLTTYEHE